MDSATQELLLQKLEELIIDEEEIITVISASEVLNITVQDANKLLQIFAQDQKQTSTNVKATYVLSGILSNGSLGVRLVKEDDLQDKKQLFKTLSDEVLYSLQKSKSIDLYNIASVNGIDASALNSTPIRGSLISKNCVVRSVKPKCIPKPENKAVIKGKSSFFIKSASTSDAEIKKENGGTSKEETKDNNKGKCALFPKTVSSGSADSKKGKETSKNPAKQEAKPKTNGGLASFFNKIPPKPVISKKEGSLTPETVCSKINENNLTVDDEEIDSIKDCLTEEFISNDAVEDVKIESTEVPSPKANKNKRQRSATKKTDKPSKRRKRIKEIVQSDSDDDMFADNTKDDTEDRIDNSDDETPTIKHKIESPPPIKNKRRKLVDKTYEDEEGFIITSKEWVYESGSEDEKEQTPPVNGTVSQKPKVEAESPIKIRKSPSPPISSNKKSKKGKKNGAANQPTLTAFFKKA